MNTQHRQPGAAAALELLQLAAMSAALSGLVAAAVTLSLPVPAPVQQQGQQGVKRSAPTWLPVVRRLYRENPRLHPFTLAVLADPEGTGRPTGAQVQATLAALAAAIQLSPEPSAPQAAAQTPANNNREKPCELQNERFDICAASAQPSAAGSL